MVKEHLEPGIDMDGLNGSEHSTGEREMKQATNSVGDGVAERCCTRQTRQKFYTRCERGYLDMRRDERLSMDIDWTGAGDELQYPRWSEDEGKGAGLGTRICMETGSGFAVRYKRDGYEARENEMVAIRRWTA